MKTLAIANTLANEKDFRVLETRNRLHEPILRKSSTNNKTLSKYEKAFLEMTEDEMKSLVSTMDGE